MVHPFEQQDSDQNCPNLDTQGVFAGADEALHFQVLLQSFEEELDFPPVFVDGGDGGGTEVHQVGEQHDLPLAHRIPNDHAAEREQAVRLSFSASELNQLIGPDIPVRRHGSLVQNFISRVVFQPGDEENLPLRPSGEQGVVVVAAIHCHNRARVEGKGIGQFHVAAPGFGNQHVAGHVVVMIEQYVSLDASLRPAELRPRKEFQTKADSGRIQRQQFVSEAKLSFPHPQSVLAAEARQRRVKQLLVQRRRTVLVSVGQGGLVRRQPYSEVHQLARAAGESIANITQRVRVCELTQQHGDQLRPATEALGRSFGIVLLYKRRELQHRKVLQQLIEQAHRLYHCFALLLGIRPPKQLRKKMIRLRNNYRRACLLLSSDCFGQD